MSLETQQVKKLLEENKIVKLDPNRSSSNRSEIIVSFLESRAMTAREISVEMKIAPNRVYTILRKLEKNGILVALSKGDREILYIAKKVLNHTP